jgi:proteic killer suppression protein
VRRNSIVNHDYVAVWSRVHASSQPNGDVPTSPLVRLLLQDAQILDAAVTVRTQRPEGVFETGSKAGIRPDHAAKLRRQPDHLDDAQSAQDMNVPGWKLHLLHGDLDGHFCVSVSGNWRMTFRFEGTGAVLVDDH